MRKTLATAVRLLAAGTLVVCLGSAQRVDVAATVKAQTGRVDVMRNGGGWALSAGDTIKPREVVKTGADGYAIFQLADGSEFEVFPDTEVTFRDNPGNYTHLLEVWLGRIRVHIQKLTGGKPNPNRIGTPTAVISVKGTIFHVTVDAPGGTTVVMVDEGLVGVQHKQVPGREVPLGAGDALTVYPNVPLAQNKVDKGALADRVARAASDILGRILWNRQGGGGSPGTTGIPGSSAPGSTTDTTTAPPTTAPPSGPPPPPPPPGN